MVARVEYDRSNRVGLCIRRIGNRPSHAVAQGGGEFSVSGPGPADPPPAGAEAGTWVYTAQSSSVLHNSHSLFICCAFPHIDLLVYLLVFLHPLTLILGLKPHFSANRPLLPTVAFLLQD